MNVSASIHSMARAASRRPVFLGTVALTPAVLVLAASWLMAGPALGLPDPCGQVTNFNDTIRLAGQQIIPCPDPPTVSITKSNSASGAVAPGASVAYTIGLGVTGTTTFVGVGVIDQLPAGIGSASAISTGGTYDPGTNKITWAGLTVSAGTTLTYTAVVAPGSAAGTYTNTASVVVAFCGQTCTAASNVTVVVPVATPVPVPSSSHAGGGVGGVGGSPRVTVPPTTTLRAVDASQSGPTFGFVILALAALAGSLLMVVSPLRRRRPRD